MSEQVPPYPDRIWLKQTHDEDGWHFGYYADRPQDCAFVEYVAAAQLEAAVAEARREERKLMKREYDDSIAAVKARMQSEISHFSQLAETYHGMLEATRKELENNEGLTPSVG